MAYLYVFVVLSILSLWFLISGWVVYVRIYRFPLKSVTFGFPKLFSFRVGATEWRIGLLPLSSSFDFGEEWMKDMSFGRSAQTRLINAMVPMVVVVLWPLVSGIGYGEMVDGLRYHTLQISMAEFVGQYGPLDLADVGALVLGMFPMMFFAGLVHLLRKESLVSVGTIVVYLAWLLAFVRMCIQLYGD